MEGGGESVRQGVAKRENEMYQVAPKTRLKGNRSASKSEYGSSNRKLEEYGIEGGKRN